MHTHMCMRNEMNNHTIGSAMQSPLDNEADLVCTNINIMPQCCDCTMGHAQNATARHCCLSSATLVHFKKGRVHLHIVSYIYSTPFPWHGDPMIAGPRFP